MPTRTGPARSPSPHQPGRRRGRRAVVGFGIGFVVGLPGWSDDLAREAAIRIATAAVLTIVLQPVTGLFASVGRGYIAGLGWAVLTVAAAQVLAVLGLGAIFPWAVPALVAGAAGPDAADVPIGAGWPGRTRRDRLDDHLVAPGGPHWIATRDR